MSASTMEVGTLVDQLESARAASDRFFEIIRESAMYERPIDARHRVIFYLGHLDGFDSIQIVREGLGRDSKDPVFDELFQAGIDPEPNQLPSDKPSDWPSLEEVRGYVDRCRRSVDSCLRSAPDELIAMAVEHRFMHLETLAYMFHNVPYSMKHIPAASSSHLQAGCMGAQIGMVRDPARRSDSRDEF